MKKIKYLLLLIPFLFISNVRASVSSEGVLPNTYSTNFELPIWSAVYNVNNRDSLNEINNQTWSVDGAVAGFNWSMTTYANSWGGLLLVQPMNNFVKDVLYTVTIVIHTNSSQLRFPPVENLGNRVYVGSSKDYVIDSYLGYWTTYSTMLSSNVSGGAYNFIRTDQTGGIDRYTADTMSFTFIPKQDCSIISIPFTTSSNVSNNTFTLQAISVQSLGYTGGLSSSEVQSIINNSGLASASSVSQVQSSINKVQQELDGVQQKQQETTNAVNKVDDTLKDDNTQQAQDSAGGFFNDFTTDTHGLTAIITAPLSLISKITSASCSPLVIPLPYVDKDLTLPCMGAIYSQYFGSFLSIYQVITFGIIAYWVCVRIFNLVKDFKNPDHDEIEVLDL